jgi:hypothetical protein
LGFHVAVIGTKALIAGARIEFTWRGGNGEWHGRNEAVTITAA